MNEKEFVKKVCSKCENRLNKIDLCHITITTNGKAKCVNEKKEVIKMLNYKEEDKKIIESGKYRYYDFTEEIIRQIIRKNK